MPGGAAGAGKPPAGRPEPSNLIKRIDGSLKFSSPCEYINLNTPSPRFSSYRHLPLSRPLILTLFTPLSEYPALLAAVCSPGLSSLPGILEGSAWVCSDSDKKYRRSSLSNLERCQDGKRMILALFSHILNSRLRFLIQTFKKMGKEKTHVNVVGMYHLSLVRISEDLTRPQSSATSIGVKR